MMHCLLSLYEMLRPIMLGFWSWVCWGLKGIATSVNLKWFVRFEYVCMHECVTIMAMLVWVLIMHVCDFARLVWSWYGIMFWQIMDQGWHKVIWIMKTFGKSWPMMRTFEAWKITKMGWLWGWRKNGIRV